MHLFNLIILKFVLILVLLLCLPTTHNTLLVGDFEGSNVIMNLILG